MSNALYDKGRESFLKGELSWNSDDIKIVLVDATYTVSLSADQFLSDVPALSRVATSSNLASKTTSSGIAGCANVVFSSVTGNQITQFVIYQDSGVAGTSRLIGYENVATGLPITPNGSDITLVIDTGTNKLFKL